MFNTSVHLDRWPLSTEIVKTSYEIKYRRHDKSNRDYAVLTVQQQTDGLRIGEVTLFLSIDQLRDLSATIADSLANQ